MAGSVRIGGGMAAAVVLIALLALLRAAWPPRVERAHRPPQDAPAPPTRTFDLGVLPYDIAVTGRPDSLIAVNRDDRERARHAGILQWFPMLDDLPSVRFPLDPERVMRERPDAILVSRDWIGLLDELALPGLVQVDYDPRATFSAKRATWLHLDQAMVAGGRATALADTYRHRQAALDEALRGVSDIRVALLASTGGSWRIAGDGYYLNSLLTAARGENVASGAADYPEVDLERLIALDPQVILLGSQASDATQPGKLYADRNWRVLRAVRERRVYKLPRFAVFLGPAEEASLLEWLGVVLHPDRQQPVRANLRRAYRDAYGVDLAPEQIDAAFSCGANEDSVGVTMCRAGPAG